MNGTFFKFAPINNMAILTLKNESVKMKLLLDCDSFVIE